MEGASKLKIPRKELSSMRLPTWKGMILADDIGR